MGGAEAVLYSLVSHFKQQGCEQHVLYIHAGPYKERIQALGIPVHQVSGVFFRYDLFFFIRLFLLLKKLQPSCVHTLLWAANCSGRLIACLLKIPCISVYHNNVNQDGVIRSVLDQLTLHAAGHIVTVSQEVKTSLENRTINPACPVSIIRNGIDYQLFKRNALAFAKKRSAVAIADDDIVIGSVARFHPVKNLDLLITSFASVYAQNPKTRLVLVGQGSEEQKLRALVCQLGLDERVTFIVGQEAVNYYLLFDCFVMSSDQEGISMALLEAMSLSIACVVTNVTKHHSVITHGYDGIVVQAQSKDQLCAALLRVCADKTLRLTLGMHAQQTIQHSFGINAMIRHYTQLFSQ
jgi:glycosyltransferase involved in cell wall biosynthesis